MRLWANECCRVFHDRLINTDDTNWFKDLTMDLISKWFKQSCEKDELFSNLRFGDLLKLGGGNPLYEYILDKPKLLKGLYGSLEEYNSSGNQKMNLVLFDDALEHVLRIGRVLK
jgi:dynein heavy chain